MTDSESMERRLAAILRARRERYVDLAVRDDANALKRRDVEQMIDGFLALLGEALETDSRETRDFFLETIIPSLVPAHLTLSQLVGEIVEYAIMLGGDAVSALPAAEQDAGRVWFARFFNGYIADVIRAASEGAK